MIFFLIELLVLFSNARPPALSQESLVNEFPREPLLNEIVILTPVAGHKFNLQAKNSCGNGALIEATEKNIKCQMTAPGSSFFTIYACDDKKTYCRAEGLDVKTQQPKGIMGWFLYYKKFLTNRDSWSTPAPKGPSSMELVQGFENGDFDKVQERAKKEKKDILLFFTQASCEPCREFKEITLISPEFQEATRKFIRYQVDIDVDMPQILRDLFIPGTPAVVILNKNSRELARSMGSAAPKTLIRWLQQVPTEPLETLLNQKIEKLSDDEKFRISSWYSEQWNDKAADQAKIYAKEIKKPTEFQFMKIGFINKPESLQGLQEWLNANEMRALQGKEGEVSDAFRLYLGAVVSLIYESAVAKDKKVFSEGIRFGARLEKMIQIFPDGMARDIELNQLYETYVESYKKWEDLKTVQAWRKKQLEVVEQLLKVPYLPVNSSYSLKRANLAGDTKAEKEILQGLQEKNKEDYSVPLYGFREKMDKKDFTGALAQVDQSLAAAKDRSWQKTFLLKLEVLREARRVAEAQVLIGEVLEKVELPNTVDLPVHRFVQNLRKEQAALRLLK